MKRIRIRMVDKNGQFGSMVIPCLQSTDSLTSDLIQASYATLSRTGARELDLIDVLARLSATAQSGTTPLIKDVAVLAFASTGPFGLKVPIMGPGSIFLPNDVTVNDALTDVQDFVAYVLAWGTDRAGNPLTSYLGGSRVGAGGP